MAFVAVPIPSSSLATPMQREAATSALSFATAADPSRRHKTRSEKPGSFDAWMLRFSSKESYDVAVQMLAVMEGVTFAGKQQPQHQLQEAGGGVFARADTESV